VPIAVQVGKPDPVRAKCGQKLCGCLKAAVPVSQKNSDSAVVGVERIRGHDVQIPIFVDVANREPAGTLFCGVVNVSLERTVSIAEQDTDQICAETDVARSNDVKFAVVVEITYFNTLGGFPNQVGHGGGKCAIPIPQQHADVSTSIDIEVRGNYVQLAIAIEVADRDSHWTQCHKIIGSRLERAIAISQKNAYLSLRCGGQTADHQINFAIAVQIG